MAETGKIVIPAIEQSADKRYRNDLEETRKRIKKLLYDKLELYDKTTDKANKYELTLEIKEIKGYILGLDFALQILNNLNGWHK